MKPKFLPATLFLLLCAMVISCSKDSSDKVKSPLEQKAESLEAFLTGKHFVPVDFYSSRAIDYNQDDAETRLETNLKPYLLPYLADDIITFGTKPLLTVDQGKEKYIAGPGMPTVDSAYTTVWGVGTIKAKDEVFFQYLDYNYTERRYTLDYYNDSTILAHVPWVSKTSQTDTATLYTLFRKK
jgi:hypothetical protein